MGGELLLHEKVTDDLGNTVEMKIWRVPVSGHAPHGYKYSLVYIAGGVRIVGFDNAERKGDHRHFMGDEAPYRFLGLLYKEKRHEG